MIRFLDFFKIPEGVRVPFVGGILYRVVSALQRWYIRSLRIDKLSLNTLPREETITVSLTSFPARIETVGYAIVSLFHQSMKPDRIILWLADSQFPDKNLPSILEQLQEKGLEICFCEDLRSHKKYHYALQQQDLNELVITYDDDIIYPENSIELLYQSHQQYRDCIICNYSGECLQENGVFLPYKSWRTYTDEGVQTPSMKIFPYTGGGVLYPYGSVNGEAFRIETMKEIAFSADDLWMRYMSVLNGTKVVKTTKAHKPFSLVDKEQSEALSVFNCLQDGNDLTLKKLQKKYPQVIKTIFQDKL